MNTIGKQFNQLAKLDIDHNQHLQRDEVLVWKHLSQLPSKPTLEDISHWLTTGSFSASQTQLAHTLLSKLFTNLAFQGEQIETTNGKLPQADGHTLKAAQTHIRLAMDILDGNTALDINGNGRIETVEQKASDIFFRPGGMASTSFFYPQGLDFDKIRSALKFNPTKAEKGFIKAFSQDFPLTTKDSVPLIEVRKHYQAFFQANPAIADKMQHHPNDAIRLIFVFLTKPEGLSAKNMNIIQYYLKNRLNLDIGDKSSLDATYDFAVHTALQKVIHAMVGEKKLSTAQIRTHFFKSFDCQAERSVSVEKGQAYLQNKFKHSPQLVDKLKQHPVGEMLLDIANGHKHSFEYLAYTLQNMGYDLGKDKIHVGHGLFESLLSSETEFNGHYHQTLHVALEAFFHDLETTEPAPKPVKIAKCYPLEQAISADKLNTAQTAIAQLTTLGLSLDDATAFVVGLAREEDTPLFEKKVHLLLSDHLKGSVCQQLKEVIQLINQGQLKQVTLEDMGELMIHMPNLATYTDNPNNFQEVTLDNETIHFSQDMGLTLKARLMTYLTLAESDAQEQKIANLIKQGRVEVFAVKASGFAAAMYYGDSSNKQWGDSIWFPIDNKQFSQLSVSQLFQTNLAARTFRSTIVHEAAHTLDDKRLEKGIRLPGLHGTDGQVRQYDPHPDSHGDQRSLEAEFNGHYAAVYYMAKELLASGQYSKGALLALEGPRVESIVNFIDKHIVRQEPVNDQDIQQLYEQMEKDLLKSYIGREETHSTKTGVMARPERIGWDN